ncbi:MAG: WG repeat-containing protein [Nostoc sp. C3-bin3]|nr:WG repeat-containing protein [Nostoc sp. C3-bin3]
MGYKWSYIDKGGKLITRLRFDTAKPFSEGVALVNVGREFKRDNEQEKAYFIGGKWGYTRKP